jgi:hypothetical protein
MSLSKPRQKRWQQQQQQQQSRLRPSARLASFAALRRLDVTVSPSNVASVARLLQGSLETLRLQLSLPLGGIGAPRPPRPLLKQLVNTITGAAAAAAADSLLTPKPARAGQNVQTGRCLRGGARRAAPPGPAADSRHRLVGRGHVLLVLLPFIRPAATIRRRLRR